MRNSPKDKIFKHIVITRFNLFLASLGNVYQDKQGLDIQRDNWLKARVALFEKYCLPSLAGQTCQDFTWLVYFDTKTPGLYKKRFAEYKKKCPQFTPLFAESDIALGKSLADDILARCRGYKYLLTTRVDNDDALQQNALAVIQKNFRPADQLGLNLYKGYRLLLGSKNLLFANRFINGPFLSFIENIEGSKKPQTVLCKQHDKFYRFFKTIQLKDNFYWVQTIHDSNLANELSGIPERGFAKLKSFAFDSSDLKFDRSMYWSYLLRFYLNPKNYVPFKWKIVLLKLFKR